MSGWSLTLVDKLLVLTPQHRNDETMSGDYPRGAIGGRLPDRRLMKEVSTFSHRRVIPRLNIVHALVYLRKK